MLFFWYSAYSHYFSDICQNGKKAAPGTNNEHEGILFPFFFSYHSSVLCETIKSPAPVINTEVIHSWVIRLHFIFQGAFIFMIKKNLNRNRKSWKCLITQNIGFSYWCNLTIQYGIFKILEDRSGDGCFETRVIKWRQEKLRLLQFLVKT